LVLEDRYTFMSADDARDLYVKDTPETEDENTLK
jgi:hypothetical protein